MELNQQQKDKLIEIARKVYPWDSNVRWGKGKWSEVEFVWIDLNGSTVTMHWHQFIFKLLNDMCSSNKPIKSAKAASELGLLCFNNWDPIPLLQSVYDEISNQS